MPKYEIDMLTDFIEEHKLYNYFDIIENEDEVILISKNKSSETHALDELMANVEKYNITEKDIEEAIKWARGR